MLRWHISHSHARSAALAPIKHDDDVLLTALGPLDPLDPAWVVITMISLPGIEIGARTRTRLSFINVDGHLVLRRSPGARALDGAPAASPQLATGKARVALPLSCVVQAHSCRAGIWSGGELLYRLVAQSSFSRGAPLRGTIAIRREGRGACGLRQASVTPKGAMFATAA